MWIPDGLDPDEAADFARERVEAEIAWAEEREREAEGQWEAKQAAKQERFDRALEEYQDEQYERWCAEQGRDE